MIVWAALAGALVFIVAGLALAARLVYVGNLDAQALADKAAPPSVSPRSASALGWPEILCEAWWPSRMSSRLSCLTWYGLPIRGGKRPCWWLLGRNDTGSLSRLSQWCAGAASVSAVRHYGAELKLRRRQSLECVHAVLIAEDCPPP